MLLDANSLEAAGDLSADVVIVGAGTVGLFLAAALAEGKKSDIVLLEAGPKVANTSLNHSTSASIGKPHAGVHLGRAAGLGGTSSLWGGQLAEFSKADLERSDAAWPISFQELQNLYRIVYRRLGIGEPAPAASYRQQFGQETESVASVERFFTYWLDQPNFATLYSKLILSEPSIRVVVNVTANGCDFDGDNARVLKCTSAAGRQLKIKSNQFVFCAGTISANRFFLSTKRFGKVPWVYNDNIGLYFQDHLGGKIAKVSIRDESRFRDYFENGWVGGIKLQPKLTLSPVCRRSLRSGACAAFTFDSAISENVANIKRTVRSLRAGLSFSSVTSRVGDVLSLGRSLLPIASRYMRSRRIFALFDQGVHLNVQAEQIPIARSRIHLSETDSAADGLVPVVVDWQHDGGELAAIYKLAEESDAYLRRHGLAELTIDPALRRRDAGFMDTLGDTYHQCGGLRMSASAGSGVVDGECRVWGTSNVWIAGAAVFPSSSHANCTLTALAIAARLLPRLQ